MEEKEVVLEGKSVSVGYASKLRRNMVHASLDFKLCRGELVCLLGANGVGKSTLLRTLAAMQPSLGGNIMLQNRPLDAYTDKERSKLIGVVLTSHTQAGGLTVRELVSLGRQPYTGFLGHLRQVDEEKIDNALRAVGMFGKSCCYVAQLSDGERQKAMIAKVLVQECPLVLLDEPTAFLDIVSRLEILSLLHRLAVEEKRAILLSTHDVEQALSLSDKLWLLSETEGLRCGVTEDLVLSHAMDTLFPHSDIRFDMLRGGYSPVLHGRQVLLTSSSEVLAHWARNALNRNGWNCVPASLGLECPHVDVRSATELHGICNGTMEHFTSFAQLIEWLRRVNC